MASFVGYHGTDEHSAVMIDKEGFQDSPSDSWLGPGIYFFESQDGFNGLKDAEWWVSTYKKLENWVILKVDISSDSVLDMFGSREDRNAFKQVKEHFLKKHLEAGGDVKSFTLKPVFMFFCRKVEVIRCVVDAARLDEFINYVVGYPQIQLCVTKSHCIRNVRREKTRSI